MTRSTSSIISRRAPASFRRSAAMDRRETCGFAASRSRICRPVVPASPSMNTVGVLAMEWTSVVWPFCREKRPETQEGRTLADPPLLHDSPAQIGPALRADPPASALAELEGTSRLRLAVLLALHDAGVAGQEAGLLQDG